MTILYLPRKIELPTQARPTSRPFPSYPASTTSNPHSLSKRRGPQTVGENAQGHAAHRERRTICFTEPAASVPPDLRLPGEHPEQLPVLTQTRQTSRDGSHAPA